LCSAGTVRRGGVLPRGDNNTGGRQKGEVNLLTLTSQVVRRSLGGLVSLGGERSNGMSFHRGAAMLGRPELERLDSPLSDTAAA